MYYNCLNDLFYLLNKIWLLGATHYVGEAKKNAVPLHTLLEKLFFRHIKQNELSLTTIVANRIFSLLWLKDKIIDQMSYLPLDNWGISLLMLSFRQKSSSGSDMLHTAANMSNCLYWKLNHILKQFKLCSDLFKENWSKLLINCNLRNFLGLFETVFW